MTIFEGEIRPGLRRGVGAAAGTAGPDREGPKPASTIREVCLVGDPTWRYRYRGEAGGPSPEVRGGLA